MADEEKPIRVCLVALNALPAIDSSQPGVWGGLETRAWLFARGLAMTPGTDVTLVVRSVSDWPGRTVEGVRVEAWRDRRYFNRESLAQRLRRNDRFPWIAWRQPQLTDLFMWPELFARGAFRRRRWRSLQRRLVESRADVYLVFGVSDTATNVRGAARETGRPWAVFLGSDGDLDCLADAAPERGPYGDRAGWGRSVLEEADLVLAQTAEQQGVLRERVKRDVPVVANPLDVTGWRKSLLAGTPLPSLADLDRYFLWIGRADPIHKRPALLLEVARELPDIPFVMVLNPRDPEEGRRVRTEAPRNVRILERVAAERMPAVFRHTAGLVNTSLLEGFSNAFLQAAASCVPVLSLQVGDEYLRRSRAGVCAEGEISELIASCRAAWEGVLPGFDAERALEHLHREHGWIRQSQRLAELLAQLAASPRRLAGG